MAEKHGKGVVDAIGATVKSKVANLIRNRQATVKNAKDFVDACNGIKTKMHLLQEATIENKREELAAFFSSSSCPAIKNVSKNFYFVAENNTLTQKLVRN